jgi:predicted nucleotidyltransferase
MMSEIDESHSTPVVVPTALVRLIEERIKGTSFPTVASYIAYVLAEVLATDETGDEAGLSEEDEERVKERLRALGYLE